MGCLRTLRVQKVVDVVPIVPPLRSEPLFDEFGHLTIRAAEYFERSAEGLQEIFDSIEVIEGRLDVIDDRLDAIELRLDLVEARITYLEGTFVVTGVDFTTIGNITVVVTADVTISLTTSPNDKDVVRIKQRGTRVTIDGNGRNIEGGDSLILRKRQTDLKTGISFIYSAELDEWFAI